MSVTILSLLVTELRLSLWVNIDDSFRKFSSLVQYNIFTTFLHILEFLLTLFVGMSKSIRDMNLKIHSQSLLSKLFYIE